MTLGSLCRVLLHCLVPGFLCAGCSVLYEAEPQCKSDSDCWTLSDSVPELVGSICQHNVCVPPAAVTHVCESNVDCVNQSNGDPAICRDNHCISLIHGECTQVINEKVLTESNDVILLGAFAPFKNTQLDEDTVFQSYQLAVDEVTRNIEGAIGIQGYEKRPFAMVTCRSTDPNTMSDSFDHLTKTLKVPVVITNQLPTELGEQVTRLIAEETNTMFLSPKASDANLENLKDRGRLWHLLGAPGELAPAFRKLIELQAARINDSELRVLTVVNDTSGMIQIADIVEQTLTINGLSVTDAMSANTYRRVAINPSSSSNSWNTSRIAPAVEEIRPNVVVLLTGPEVVIDGIVTLEKSWLDYGLTEAPKYVMSQNLFNSGTLRDELLTLVGSESRMYGVNYAGAENRTLYQSYLRRLYAVCEKCKADYENFYDAAYFAMLSVIGAAQEVATSSITGDLAVKGFRRLIDANGLPYDLKPETLAKIAAVLQVDPNATLYLTATLGAPDFNADGSRNSDAVLWCIKRDGNTISYPSGDIRFDAETEEFSEGLDACGPNSP